jgi:hypothetical protein
MQLTFGKKISSHMQCLFMTSNKAQFGSISFTYTYVKYSREKGEILKIMRVFFCYKLNAHVIRNKS